MYPVLETAEDTGNLGEIHGYTYLEGIPHISFNLLKFVLYHTGNNL